MSSILIAVPCMEMVYANFMCCLMELQKPENTKYTAIKSSLIYNARNEITKMAIDQEFDRVLWLDSDMIFAPDSLIKLNERMDEDKDFVSGLYFSRMEPIEPVIYKDVWWKLRDENTIDTGTYKYYDYPKESIFQIAGSGFGIVMTSVDMLKAVTKEYGAAFTPMIGMGEDLSFCWRATQLGYKLYCDSSIKCGHMGPKIFGESMYLADKNEYKV